MVKVYVMRGQIYGRWIKRHGEPPKCYNCGKILNIGETVVSTQIRNFAKLRCLECAEKINLILRREIVSDKKTIRNEIFIRN